jgi:Icc-related predicted phosphoesterase
MDRDERNRADVVRLVLLSDTHGQHRTLRVPDGDLLIHAGDFTLLNKSRDSVRDFNHWLLELPFSQKLVIPGNHDFKFADPKWRDLISAATFLLNEGVDLDGIKIWGSPLTPSNFSSFGAKNEADCDRIFSGIPAGTDLVITHGPPRGILDIAESVGGQQGCALLLSAIRRVRPALHVFGHIHQSYGIASVNGTVFVNAALAGPRFQLIRKPIVIEYDRLTRSVRESGNSAGIQTRLGRKK